MKITNIDVGPRGVFTKAGLVVLQPGETKDVELEKAEADGLQPEWFARGAVKTDALDHDGDGKKGGSVPAGKS